MKTKAEEFLNEEISNIEEALEGAQDIIAEHISDNPKYRSRILKEVSSRANYYFKKKMLKMKRNLRYVL